MEWWHALIVALSTMVVTKLVDLLISLLSEQRDFKKYRRELALNEIENIKTEIGKIYELAANWRSYSEKQQAYIHFFEYDHELIGRLNNIPQLLKQQER